MTKSASMQLAFVMVVLLAVAIHHPLAFANTPVPLMASQTEVDWLGDTKVSGTTDVAVDRAGRTVIRITSSHENLDTEIIGPLGEVINPQTVVDFGGSFIEVYSSSEDLPGLLPLPTDQAGYHYIYTFDAPTAGFYQVAYSFAGAGPVSIVTIQALLDSQVQAAFFTTGSLIQLGDSLVLSAIVLDGENPADAVVEATVSVEDFVGPGQVLELLDDGLELDHQAGDGIYSARLVPDTPGIYRVFIEIDGFSSGEFFKRDVAGSFEVLDLTGMLKGGFDDQGIDDDNDGRFDRIRIETGIDVTIAGDYIVFIQLEASNGETIFGRATATLGAGDQSMGVDYSALDIRALGVDGPYIVKSIELLFDGDDGAKPADELTDLGQTAAYALTDMERDPIEVSLVSDSGLDVDSNGFFDYLAVVVDFDVDQIGNYWLSLKLTDQDYNEIARSAGQTYLNLGANEVTFYYDGIAISRSGADGPYYLRDLLVTGTANLIISHLGETGAYEAAQFGLGEIAVSIDIMPGNADNVVNLGSNGTIPVGILTTSMADGDVADFDVADVDPTSLRLAGAEAMVKGKSGNYGANVDVDHDGDLDLLVHFITDGMSLSEADVEANLYGATIDGMAIQGSDLVTIVPPN